MLKKKIPLSKIAESYLDKNLSPNVNRTMGQGCDNMSIIVIKFGV